MSAPTTRPAVVDPAQQRDRILARYASVRGATESLAAPLSPEDQQVQSMPEASPTKWHRAHTTWFFETFVLAPAGVDVFDRRYESLYNSYYESLGPPPARGMRGLLSRPSAAEVSDYRRAVDERLTNLLARCDGAELARVLPVVELGIAHEEQHQELLLTDILHAFWESPLRPAYRLEPPSPARSPDADPIRFVLSGGGLREIGAPPGGAFAFDNELPRHKRWIEPFELASRLVSVRELKDFIDAGGYRTPSLWLSEGFDFVRTCSAASPLYSSYEDGELYVFTLAGSRRASDDEPAVHVSYYEADAIARFLGARLPTEAEWETFAAESDVRGNFADSGVFRPLPAAAVPVHAHGVRQIFGDAWEWTRSSYEPYPGYEAPAGALGEYNGKFMVNQQVLRGGSCLTPTGHVRASYRNFWHPRTRFQMAGIRLARSVAS